MMIASFAAKMAAVAMTVYMTKRVGIWGHADESDRLFREVGDKLKPLSDLLPIPKPEREMSLAQLAKEAYNSGIKDGFDMLKNLPKYSDDLAAAVKEACLELAKEIERNIMPNEKNDPNEENHSTIVIISPGIPLKMGGGEADKTTSNSTTTTTTTGGSTDLALKQAGGTTPGVSQASSKNDHSH